MDALADQLTGRIVKEQSGFYWVETDAQTASARHPDAQTQTDSAIYICRLRGRLKETAQASDIAAIGDRVCLTPTPHAEIQQQDNPEADEPHHPYHTPLRGVIERVEARHSVLSRAMRTAGKRGAGQAEREHVLIANADQAFFVFAATQPVPNTRMLDRFLVAGEKSEIDDLVIIINKIDLEDPSRVNALTAPYRTMGYEVLYTSAVQNVGIDALRERLRGKISVFTGPSGVGKTSLLNHIQPGLARQVKSVSAYSSEGMHTTRDSALIKLDVGGYLADTPGIRQLTVWDVEPDELDGYFRDIAEYVDQCRFRNCTHTTEPGCAVQAALKSGAISRQRFNNFQRLRDELKNTYIVY